MLENGRKLDKMNLEQIKDVQRRQKDWSLPFTISRRGIYKGLLYVNGNIPIVVENIATVLDSSTDIPIHNEEGLEIGYLCFTKGKIVDNLDALSELHFCCYLIEVTDDSSFSVEYTFRSNYAVIYYNHLPEYLTYYRNSAPLWGFYHHNYPSISINSTITKTYPFLQATREQKFSEGFYFESSVRGIKQSLAFERFLKYYHLLELNFDYDVIKRIKDLNISTDSNQIGVLLNAYERNDIDRLVYLFETYCLNVLPIVDKLNSINPFLAKATHIFYKFGKKDSNPLKDETVFATIVGLPDGFSEANCRTHIGHVRDAATHRSFIGKLCMYWIYRIRCSIAHNKVGEYLMPHTDEDIVVNFAEPLLLELLKQIFR
jgi:hypothetical protein